MIDMAIAILGPLACACAGWLLRDHQAERQIRQAEGAAWERGQTAGQEAALPLVVQLARQLWLERQAVRALRVEIATQRARIDYLKQRRVTLGLPPVPPIAQAQARWN